MKPQARLRDQLALSHVGRPVLSRRDQRLAGKSRCRPQRRPRARSRRVRAVRRYASTPGSSGGRRRECFVRWRSGCRSAAAERWFARSFLSGPAMRWPIAGVLISLGVMRFFRHRHPRRVGMVGFTVWSFLMATAHGAGLMVVPVFVGMSMSMADGGGHLHHAAAAAGTTAGCRAVRHRSVRRELSGSDGILRCSCSTSLVWGSCAAPGSTSI